MIFTLFKKNLLSLIILLSALLLPVAVFALETNYPTILGISLPSDPNLENFAGYFINIGISMSGILAGLVIIFGGLQYIVFGAMGRSTSEGKEWVKSGFLGLFLLVCSYIILSTINPALVKQTTGELAKIIPFVGTNINTLNQGPPQIFYKEIPMGTLTETVLSRTISCYDYNEDGDPILNKVKTDKNDEIDGPTFLDHDRVSCMLKLNEAISRKSRIIKDLSVKISDLMSQCQCSEEKGCKNNDTCLDLGYPEVQDPSQCQQYSCGGNMPCQCKTETTCGVDPNDPGEFKLCPAGTKKLVEKGPINLLSNSNFSACFSLFPFNRADHWIWNAQTWKMIDFTDCLGAQAVTQGKNYQGLDEFRTQIGIKDIINLIEATVQVNKKDVIIMNKQNWDNLKLIEQLEYLREKLNQTNTTLSQDSKNLNSAGAELNSCYLATPYVDYLKTIEQTDKNQQILMVQKNYDSYQNKFTDISRYCAGFGYAKSSCFYKCENACPAYSPQALACDKSCQTPDCNALCSDNSQSCLAQKNTCVQNQNSCLSDCFNNRPCPNSASGDFNNFQNCMTSCNNQCKQDCQVKYPSCKFNNTCSNCINSVPSSGNITEICKGICPDQTLDPLNFLSCFGACTANYPAPFPPGFCDTIFNSSCFSMSGQIKYACDNLQKCQDACNTDSKCLLDNKEKCLYNPSTISKTSPLIQCSNLTSDSENIKNCIENSAFTCEYGSSQNAGYADCLKKPYSLQNSFSASDIFKNATNGQDQQKCPNPFVVNISSPCYSSKSPKSACGDSCPEVSKCPPSSECPKCPCTTISSNSTSTQITDYQIVGGECQNFKYNDDPLTFYCKQDWWNEPELKNPDPLANNYVCPKEKEIPVGQAVDDTQKWETKLFNYTNDFIKKTDELINLLTGIGKEQGYCECGAQCQAGEAACNSNCSPSSINSADADGNPIFNCVCLKQACGGNPCQKMINLLMGKEEGAACPKGKPINGTVSIYDQLNLQLKVIGDFALKGRTDVVKELIYSRTTINNCSSESKANTVAQQTKLVSCERVSSNFISPIAGDKTIVNGKEMKFSCYGKTLGDIINSSPTAATNYSSSSTPPSPVDIPKTDNWFCCQPRK